MVAIIVCLAGVGWAYDSPEAQQPHVEYTPKYVNNCFGNYLGACHDYNKGSFLPETLTGSSSSDYAKFCLGCHNVAGEAHERSAGSASTNAYVNQTSLGAGPFDGNSHSWTGVVGNAGTVEPTLFGGTAHMPLPGSNVVTCQVCHQGMSKVREQNLDWRLTTTSDNINYVIDNGSGQPMTSTKQYLAQYIRVFRSTGLITRPGNSRTKKDYLVSPSEYTYNSATATVTFLSAQSGSDYIYVDIGQPYFRDGNTANAMCLNCHQDRTDSAVSHDPGTGATDSHPVVVSYGHTSGLHDTLKSSADSNIYLEGGQVLCTSCHDPHNAASDDGQLTRSADSSELCTDCHETNGFDIYSTQAMVANHNGSKHSAPTVCLDCHTTHKSNNILLIKDRINGKAVIFSSFSGADSFADESGDSVCEACHTTTNYHRNDSVYNASNKHNTSKRCIDCHSHASGFGGGGCSGCHAFPPDDVGPFLVGWNDTTGDAHHAHQVELAKAPFNLAGNAMCGQCHGSTIPRTDHSNQNAGAGKPSAGIDTTTWTNWTAVGGDYGTVFFDYSTTTGMVDTSDDYCGNVSCHSTGGTRVWGGGGCTGCHDYPVPGSNWLSGGHTVQYDGVSATHLPATGYDPANDDYVAMTTDPTKCGKCHYNTFGSYSSHNNKTVNLKASGNVACGPDTAFTINQTVPGSNVTCSNVKCHSAGSSTPNWF